MLSVIPRLDRGIQSFQWVLDPLVKHALDYDRGPDNDKIQLYTQTLFSDGVLIFNSSFLNAHILRSLLKKPHTLTLALSPQRRGDLRIAPPLRGGDKGEGV